MASKKKRTHKVSKGERRSIVAGVYGRFHGPIDRAINLIDAWRKGQNPWVTVSTPEKNKPFIRVKANDEWGNPRRKQSGHEEQ